MTTLKDFGKCMQGAIYSLLATPYNLWVGDSKGSLKILDIESQEHISEMQNATIGGIEQLVKIEQKIYIGDSKGNLAIIDFSTFEIEKR